jgi:hypothetical protein
MKASNYQGIARGAILAGGLAAAGVLSVGESAQAQFIGTASQSRVSGATTSILTDGNTAATNSFAVEQVLPAADYVFTGTVTVTVSYATQNINAQTVVAIESATLSAVNGSNAGQGSVERATAAAISAASGKGPFGDVSGIVRAWSAGTSVLE